MSRLKTFAILLAACAASLACLMLMAGVASAAGRGQVKVELQQTDLNARTTYQEFSSQQISGADGNTRQAYKFQRVREGRDFTYVVSNLDSGAYYSVELSFVEHRFTSQGQRYFGVYINNSIAGWIDVLASAGGANTALQYTYGGIADNGRISIRFTSTDPGCIDNAMVSTIRLYQESGTTVEINASSSRNKMPLPVRFQNSGSQNLYETVLGRLGARLSLDTVPQRLGARFTTLGTGTGDLSDLVLGLYDRGTMHCLPFTDRYALWENISQSTTMTSVTYSCSSPYSGFQEWITLRAPFYPRNEKVSSAPFVYVDVCVRNVSGAPANGKFVFAMPQKKEFGSLGAVPFSTANSSGIKYQTSYSYDDESISPFHSRNATEALALPAGSAGDVTFKGPAAVDYGDFAADRLWGYGSPDGFPNTYNDPASPVFTYYPRGYVGAVWDIAGLAPGAYQTKTFVLAGYTGDHVLGVMNPSYTDWNYKFRYTTLFGDVTQVTDYAAANRWVGDAIEDKCDFFDSTVNSDSYFMLDSSYAGQARDMSAYSLQSFLVNTWWARSDSGRDWFSVWEGTDCRYHSTVDVEYNDAWFYYEFWPDLLKEVMDEWVLYQKASPQGFYLSHDMGYNDGAVGQSYPDDMPVEENCNYILMLYKYWKTTGDGGFVNAKYYSLRTFMDFLINCDTNGNGLPDINCVNTVDQGSPGIRLAKDQIYLGVKCASAYRAAKEMADSVGDFSTAAAYQAKFELINETLEQDCWLSDHFAVALNGGMNEEDRQAYSIYASNGLNYLLSGTRDPGFTATNMSRIQTDLGKATTRTLREFGCTHSSYDANNEWASQNIWRDQVACRLGVKLEGASPLAMTPRYWSMQQFFARYMNGGWWDVVTYPGGGMPPNPSVSSGGGPKITSTGGGYQGYDQFLGYYPRGGVNLGIFEAAAGLVLDAPSNSLYYNASASAPLRVPVFSRADWSNPDPGRRIPSLYFPGGTAAPTVVNQQLLPGNMGQNNVADCTIQSGRHAITPDGDGVNDTTTVNFNLPGSATVHAAIWKGDQLVRNLYDGPAAAGASSVTWNGLDNSGNEVADGVYRARVDAGAWDGSAYRPASADVWVNRTVPNRSRTWYLAEGYTGTNPTGGQFEEYILVQNPSAETAHVEMTFMMPGGATQKRSFTVGPASRYTVTLNNIIANQEISTLVRSDKNISVERSMYFNGRKAGHDSIGVTSPSLTWYLPEGYTAKDFDEYILIQNPGDETASVTATYMTSGAGTVEKKYTAVPHSRFTIHVNKILPGQEVSTRIEGSKPLVVERAQYLNYMKSGTDSIGATSYSNNWYLAEGYTDQGFEEYVLLQNPGTNYNNVKVWYMMSDGTNRLMDYQLQPQSRYTIGVGDLLPGKELSIKIKGQYPLIVERSMYWNKRSDGHDSIATPTPDCGWDSAEGYTAQGFETWELIQNPNDSVADVTVVFMEPSGKNTTKRYQLPPRSRYTIGVGDIIPNAEVSASFSSSVPIIVERAVYFNKRSGGTDSLAVRGQ